MKLHWQAVTISNPRYTKCFKTTPTELEGKFLTSHDEIETFFVNGVLSNFASCGSY